jgi:pimeloyl-ACP methyl ester carboxylesterase
MDRIRPFEIELPRHALDELRRRVERTIWPHVLGPSCERYGPSLASMQGLAEKLRAFDGRAAEAALRRFPHFVTTVDGQDLHFVHVASSREGAIPLMLIHGWPGSFADYLDVIEPLTEPGRGGPVFDVIIPSLPGFAFSGPTREVGWNDRRIARALLELMGRLGYDRFAVHGADVGAVIAPEMARLAPERLLGVHVTAATLGFIPLGPVDEAVIAELTAAEKERLERLQTFVRERFGFNLLHSHQPQLVAYAISDSPVGLLAWMSQLFGGIGIEDRLLLDFVIYWVTGTAASSIRLYFENAHDPDAWAPREKSSVPTGVAVYQEGDVAIRRYAEDGNTIVRWREYAKGGHHAVLEVPAVWIDDVRGFFAELRS